MAIYSKAVSANPVVNGGVTVCNGEGTQNYNDRAQSFTNIDSLTMTTVLDNRYKNGPSGTWE